MIIDNVKITVEAGKGGDGAVAFSKLRFAPGPTGGNGGRGGDVFIEGVSDLSALNQFRFKKNHKAENGENGKNKLNDGHRGKDLILLVPVGTVCHDLANKKDIEVERAGQRELIAKGGKGGKGNYFFRSSTNTTPKQFQEGKPGEFFELQLELKMIADVGFVGLPNAGKSSLLNKLTKAHAKVADYPFTTLGPNLGAYFGLIIADVPGLIKGASLGKGLGIKFLRHIERTKILFHLVSAQSLSPLSDYKTVRKELENYGDLLLKKREYIFLSKCDAADDKTIEKIEKEFKKIGKKISPISIINPDGMKKIKEILNGII